MMLRWEDLAKKAQYDLQELAALCQVSVRTVQRHFTANYGLRPNQWLQSLRLREAYKRITAGEEVKAAAYSLGFTELSNFSRAFKRRFGVSPRKIANSATGRLHAITRHNDCPPWSDAGESRLPVGHSLSTPIPRVSETRGEKLLQIEFAPFRQKSSGESVSRNPGSVELPASNRLPL